MNFIEHLFINLNYQNENENFLDFYVTLEKEINILKENYQLQIKTIYIATNDFLFLTNQQLVSLLSLLKQFTNNLTEYSFEIGYETLQQEQLEILKQFSINRLVWKVRTFSTKFLSQINQNFNAEKMMSLIKVSFEAGYRNFSIDLENNISKQSKSDLISDLKITLKLNSPHISYQSHNDSHSVEKKKIISEFLKQHNYQNYEFFSFTKAKKYYSQQTLAYLTLKNWYGLGPNASSFLKLDDQFITINNSGQIPWNSELITLTHEEYYQLILTQNLMLQEGIALKKNDVLKHQAFWPQITTLITNGYLQLENDYLKATNQGWDLLNDILIDIIIST
ncbi:hypothetical protein [Spiroplasma platyhelix]|uniref:Oxygen-independent coproporphyrinogen III oxidase n=1 Tax=Spiroplasma platyhelix PALS-1 TaxID=1276218 RepID=A0A846TVQ0_9MOLU|nr:hypothetical protein [Spiroplasma platyhelix]MBE4703849.1 hypothetical protein [Spiroplasma platyhelix PALS-1]NKE38222.1 hypothetical protein [Spiroplasma platyhelix PALS-1]UJB29107.1 coproporphyrinogen III oxidase [Spiroplasma platyhelix PALS-1]